MFFLERWVNHTKKQSRWWSSSEYSQLDVISNASDFRDVLDWLCECDESEQSIVDIDVCMCTVVLRMSSWSQSYEHIDRQYRWRISLYWTSCVYPFDTINTHIDRSMHSFTLHSIVLDWCWCVVVTVPRVLECSSSSIYSYVVVTCADGVMVMLHASNVVPPNLFFPRSCVCDYRSDRPCDDYLPAWVVNPRHVPTLVVTDACIILCECVWRQASTTRQMNGIDNQLYMTIVFIFVFNYSTPSPVHCYFLFHRSIPPV
jgi:hypothetical protein